MAGWRGPTFGLLGRLFTILLLVLLAEVVGGTLLFERASRALVQDDEAHRLAEHLALARRLLGDRPPAERAAFAARLSTTRYRLNWPATPVATLPSSPDLRVRVLAWEPELRRTDLVVGLTRGGQEANLLGAMRLPDRSWLGFRVREGAAIGRPRLWLILLPFALLLATGSLLFNRILRPLRLLARAAERIGRTGGAPRLPETGPLELRRLIRAFNRMQASIAQLIRDRTEALAAVGHDLRTPLARLQLRADAVADPQLRQALGADVAEMEHMVASLLSFLGGADDPEPAIRVDLAVMAATVADDAADRGGAVEYLGQPHLEVAVRAVAMKRAITNLVENAVRHGGSARVAVLAGEAGPVVRVDDDGPGIPPERLNDVIQPFTRLDPARGRDTGGLGLGLAIVARAIEREGGSLHLLNRATGGLRVELRLPRR